MDFSNYFAFYEIEPAFDIDTEQLRKKYLQINRDYHPDFFALNPEKQKEALHISSYNNDAYKTLNSFEKRVAYYLSLHGLYDKESKAELPPDFLMEVMELNEELADAQFEGDEKAMAALQEKIQKYRQECILALQAIGEELEKATDKTNLHQSAKNEFQKLKYFNNLFAKSI